MRFCFRFQVKCAVYEQAMVWLVFFFTSGLLLFNITHPLTVVYPNSPLLVENPDSLVLRLQTRK